MLKLNRKGQGALEYLLVIAGVILIAIIVIYIIVTSGSSSRDKVDDSYQKVNNLTDSAIFPPRIKSVTCAYKDINTIRFNLRIFESPTPGIDTYCLYLSGRDINRCSVYSGATLVYDYNILTNIVAIDNNTFNLTLISLLDENNFSNPSVSERCTIR